MDKARLKDLLGGGPARASGGEDDPGVSAAQDIISAVKSGDAEMLDQALRDHYEACDSEPKGDEGAPEGPEGD